MKWDDSYQYSNRAIFYERELFLSLFTFSLNQRLDVRIISLSIYGADKSISTQDTYIQLRIQ